MVDTLLMCVHPTLEYRDGNGGGLVPEIVRATANNAEYELHTVKRMQIALTGLRRLSSPSSRCGSNFELLCMYVCVSQRAVETMSL